MTFLLPTGMRRRAHHHRVGLQTRAAEGGRAEGAEGAEERRRERRRRGKTGSRRGATGRDPSRAMRVRCGMVPCRRWPSCVGRAEGKRRRGVQGRREGVVTWSRGCGEGNRSYERWRRRRRRREEARAKFVREQGLQFRLPINTTWNNE